MNSILNRESLRVEIITLDDNTKGIFIPLETAAKIFNLLPAKAFGIIETDIKEELSISLTDALISSLENFISYPYELYKTSRYIGVRSKSENSNYRKKTGIYAIYNSNKKELSLSIHSTIVNYHDVLSKSTKNTISEFHWIKEVIPYDSQDSKILRNSMNKNNAPKEVIDGIFKGYIPTGKYKIFFDYLTSYIRESIPELYKDFLDYLNKKSDIYKIMSGQQDKKIKLPVSQDREWWEGKKAYEEEFDSAREQMHDLHMSDYDEFGEYIGLWNCYEEWVEGPYLDYQPFFKKMVQEEIIYPIDTDPRFQGTSRLIFRNVTDVENFIDDIQDGLNKFFAEAS